jgi:4-alpha-glucanotransferase
MQDVRRSGVLLHLTSLPGNYGIGTLNHEAYHWVNFLAQTHQTLWQVLPLGPTGYGDSPYQSFSSFAGNPYLISLEALVEMGLLDQGELDNAPEFPRHLVDFGAIYTWKMPLLRHVAEQFDTRASAELKAEFSRFVADNADWLEDFALFMALKDAHNGAPWIQWDMPLRSRQKQAIGEARTAHAGALHNHRLNQWLFYRQWLALKGYANGQGIQIVGDIPIFVAMDSSDAWTNPKEFFLDDQYQPTVVAGVPPDYFSVTGQLWGNPLYNWKAMKKNGYAWWLRRIRAACGCTTSCVSTISAALPAIGKCLPAKRRRSTARGRKGREPTSSSRAQGTGRELPIIAEDLGEITPDVVELRNSFGLPGMKILQFAFSTDASDKFLPHNYERNFIVYTGTHDNDTTWGWYERTANDHERDFARRYLRTDGHDIAWSMIDAAFRSVALYAIVPLQDMLNLRGEARMNLPGRAEGNWAWRFVSAQLTGHVSQRLVDSTLTFGRAPKTYAGKDPEAGGQSGQETKGAGGG